MAKEPTTLAALPTEPPTAEPPATDRRAPADERSNSKDRAEPGLVWLNIYEIDRNPYQPRQDFDHGELQSLYQSVVDHGMLQPLVVRRTESGFELISGERRLRAATMAGWEKVPVQVRRADARQMAELAIVERSICTRLANSSCVQPYSCR